MWASQAARSSGGIRSRCPPPRWLPMNGASSGWARQETRGVAAAGSTASAGNMTSQVLPASSL